MCECLFVCVSIFCLRVAFGITVLFSSSNQSIAVYVRLRSGLVLGFLCCLIVCVCVCGCH